MRAYVLVKIATGKEREAIDAFQGIASLEEIDFLFGEYDYILTLNATDTSALAQLVTNRIRKASGVARTMTLLEAPM